MKRLIKSDKIYFGLINNFLKPYAIIDSKRKFGRIFESELKSLQSQNNNSEVLYKDFLKYCEASIPFYKNNNYDILTKEIVKSNYNSILGEKPYKFIKTSGSTGTPMKVPFSKFAYQREYSFWYFYRSKFGVSFGDKTATIAGHKIKAASDKNPPYWVFNEFNNQLIFSSYHINDNTISGYVHALNDFKPVLIYGYPSSIYLIAKYINDKKYKIFFQPKMIQVVSETLLEFQKTKLRERFDVDRLFGMEILNFADT